jgi:preprotein translocase SecE subunit
MAVTDPKRLADQVASKKVNISWKGFSQYLREVREELAKAKWPTRAEMIRMTQLVLLVITVVALYCGGLDAGLRIVTERLFAP